MDFSQHGAEIFVPGEVFASNSATKASTIVYKTLNNILTLKKEDAKNEEKNGKTKFKSGSNIVSATILPRPVSPMRKPIKFVFHHKNKASYQTAKTWEKMSFLCPLSASPWVQAVALIYLLFITFSIIFNTLAQIQLAVSFLQLFSASIRCA